MEINKQRGFTLVEILITLAIVGVIATVSYNMFFSIIATYKKTDKLINLQNNTNHAMGIMERRILSASKIYNFEGMASCIEGGTCSANWIVLEQDTTSLINCSHIGLSQPAEGANPDLWTTNGYIYLEDVPCASVVGGVPASPITNPNNNDTINGVNVSNPTDNKLFVIEYTLGENPPTIHVNVDMRQGVSGTGIAPLDSAVVTHNTEAIFSLR